MKKITKLSLAAVLTIATVIVAVKSLAQIPPPVLSITALGTNTYNVTVSSNGVAGTVYALEWTPALANADYPWTIVGTNTATNFLFEGEGYSSGFFRVAVDTNAVPFWELADPNNPSLGILSVTIDSPANGSTLQ